MIFMNLVSPSPTSNNSTNTGHLLAAFACLFITFLIITKVVSEKYFLFIGIPVSSSTIIYPLTFLIIHITTQLYGLQQGKMLIIHGLSISIIVSILLWVARELPIATNSPVSTADFENVLGSSPGLTISSLGAYFVGQLINLYLFAGFKTLLDKRFLWLRSISISLCAQLVDAILLAMALYVLGTTSTGQGSFLSSMFGHYTLQALVTFLSTPFVYISIVLERQQVGYRIVK